MDIPNIPGLGFHPTDDELLTYYLKQRILDYLQDPTRSVHSHTVPDIDLFSMHPKQLPRHIKRLASVKSNGRDWVFFCARKEKYRNSSRSERTVLDIGYWKITSKPKEVKSESGGNLIGSKNILTFYEGRHPKGIKTDWILHEYHLNASCLRYNITQMPFVVCRLYYKGRKLDESTCEDNSTGRVTSETFVATCQHTPSQIMPEPEIWKSLSPIQQLPNDLPYHNISNFTGTRAEYLYSDEAGSSFGGYSDGNDSNYLSTGEPSYYQQYQGGWNPRYY